MLEQILSLNVTSALDDEKKRSRILVGSSAGGYSPVFILYLFVVVVTILTVILLIFWCLFQHYRIWFHEETLTSRAEQINEINQRILDSHPGFFLEAGGGNSRRQPFQREEADLHEVQRLLEVGDNIAAVQRVGSDPAAGGRCSLISNPLPPGYEELTSDHPPPSYESVISDGHQQMKHEEIQSPKKSNG